MELRHPGYNRFQRNLEEQENERARQQAKPPAPQPNAKQAVMAFLPQIPASMSARTYLVKQKTGKHCTLMSLQKYARELFESKYKIAFQLLPAPYQCEINRMVEDAYYGMKEARSFQ